MMILLLLGSWRLCANEPIQSLKADQQRSDVIELRFRVNLLLSLSGFVSYLAPAFSERFKVDDPSGIEVIFPYSYGQNQSL